MKQYYNLISPCGFLLFIVCVFLIIPQRAYSQETTLPAGGDAQTTNGSFSYSLGQLCYTSIENLNGSLHHGVQQCYEITEVTGIKTQTNYLIECAVYPNPTTDILELTIQNSKSLDGITYTLYNASGQVLRNESAQNNTTIIPMDVFIPSMYFLEVRINNSIIKTFKIVKN